MKIFVDADACPVKDQIIKEAMRYEIEVIMVMSICHLSSKNNALQQIVVDNESQSVDITIVNKVTKNDIVITDDYGLASMVLMKKAYCLSSKGLIYTVDNIDQLMCTRYLNQQMMKGGGRIKGPSKRTREDDMQFLKSFEKVIIESLNSPHP